MHAEEKWTELERSGNNLCETSHFMNKLTFRWQWISCWLLPSLTSQRSTYTVFHYSLAPMSAWWHTHCLHCDSWSLHSTLWRSAFKHHREISIWAECCGQNFNKDQVAEHCRLIVVSLFPSVVQHVITFIVHITSWQESSCTHQDFKVEFCILKN